MKYAHLACALINLTPISLATVGLIAPVAASAAEPISVYAVYAAGSLRAPLTELAANFASSTGSEVRYTFGASGLLKERIEKNEPADIFASANTEHPQSLADRGLAGGVQIFTRNEMCALVSSKILNAAPETLLKLMLDPAIKLGTSTPKADPSGDYAFQVFEKAAAIAGKSASDTLKTKALQLTGGHDSPPPTGDRNIYAELVAAGKADIFLTYCTNAALAVREQPALKRVALPASLAVGVDYGLTTLKRAGLVRISSRIICYRMRRRRCLCAMDFQKQDHQHRAFQHHRPQ